MLGIDPEIQDIINQSEHSFLFNPDCFCCLQDESLFLLRRKCTVIVSQICLESSIILSGS